MQKLPPLYSNAWSISDLDENCVLSFQCQNHFFSQEIARILLSPSLARDLSSDLCSFLETKQRSSSRYLKILVVDDKKSFRDDLMQGLSHKKTVLYSAVNGLEAIEVAKKVLPDIIIIDHIMPVLNGLDAARKIKNDPVHQDVPIYLMIGYGLVDDFCDYLGKTIHKIVKKPVEIDSLKEEILDFLY